MKTNPYSNFSTEFDPYNPYVPAGTPASVTPRSELTDRSWPFIGSLALHTLLFATLFHSGFQYPITITNQSPAIFWFSMITRHDNGVEAGVPPDGPSVASTGQWEASDSETSRQYPDDADAPGQEDLPDSLTESDSAAEAVLTVATPQPVKITAEEGYSPKPLPVSPRQPPPVPAPSPVKTSLIASQARKDSVPLEPVAGSQRATPAKQPAVTKPVENHPSGNDDSLKNEADHVAVESAMRKVMVNTPPLDKPATSQSKKSPVTQTPPQPKDNPMPVSLPRITGDLKLIISGDKLPDATITFKDFPLSRRDRPFSRAEALRISKVVPQIANTQDNSREIVIDRTRPGVYTITIEHAGEVADINLILKLYEDTSRTITRTLGKLAISHRQVICKILMPEGIFWDDNSAFSGNMEDSDGITKFNSETGLMWKEYND